MAGQGTIPDQLKADHLILLVGGNPLPNAVAGKLLLNLGGRITLVHSTGPHGTGPIADRLTDWFIAQGITDIAPIEVSESSGRDISNKITSVLSHADNRIALNYTGGTKTMSVFAFDALKRWASANHRKPLFSYLDARTLQIIFDSGQKFYVGRPPELSFDIETLFSLQGWSLACNQNLSSHNTVPSADGVDKGGLLEIKTGAAVNALFSSHQLTEFYMNVNAVHPDIQGHAPEFDVITLRGYQLFFFSCATTAERSKLKHKLFEATIRARQIGGDEACVALVCLKTDPTLEAEARHALGAAGRITVFHGAHQNNLQQHISDWIAQQSKEYLA